MLSFLDGSISWSNRTPIIGVLEIQFFGFANFGTDSRFAEKKS